MNDKDEKEKQEEEKKDIDSVFCEMYVKLQFGRGEEFILPRGIVNYYHLRAGDALHCELVELRGEDQTKISAIGKDVLIKVQGGKLSGGRGILYGVFDDCVFDLYEIVKYRYALLKIKSVVRNKN